MVIYPNGDAELSEKDARRVQSTRSLMRQFREEAKLVHNAPCSHATAHRRLMLVT